MDNICTKNIYYDKHCLEYTTLRCTPHCTGWDKCTYVLHTTSYRDIRTTPPMYSTYGDVLHCIQLVSCSQPLSVITSLFGSQRKGLVQNAANSVTGVQRKWGHSLIINYSEVMLQSINTE